MEGKNNLAERSSSAAELPAKSLLELTQVLANAVSADFLCLFAKTIAQITEASEVLVAPLPSRAKPAKTLAYWTHQQALDARLSPVTGELANLIAQHASLRIDDFSTAYPGYRLPASLASEPLHTFCSVRLDNEHGQPIGYVAASYSQGAPEQFAGLCQPFIARLLAEFQQHSLNQDMRLSAVAFETNEGLLVTDTELTIVRVNQAFNRITGYRQDEVLGRKLSELLPGIELAGVRGESGEQRYHCEVKRERKNGQAYLQQETLTAVTNSESQVTHYVLCVQDVSARKESEQKIQHLAYYDELTGLPNRRKLREELMRCFELAREQDSVGALLFIDLDHFKNINDSLGHAAGDWLLQQVSSRLQNLIRQGDVLARLGGDEFVLLLGELGQSPPQAEQQANMVAKRLIKTVSRPYSLDGQELHIGASVGITLYPGKQQQADDLLKQADTAMYQAKSAGRRTAVFFEQGMQRRADKRLKLHNALRSALVNDEFLLYFQPQHMVSNGELVGAEALVRWQREGQGLVSPTEFIPVAEESDLIIDIGMWVLEQSCKSIETWRELDLELPELSVNISAKQFHHPDFVDRLEELLWRYKVDTSMLNLEITEAVIHGHAEDTIQKMEQLKALGLRFSIDDFGAGYSSLSYLKRLPVDELKIDRSFIRDIPRDRRDMAIVEAVLAMARHLGFTVTAEGVETPQQLAFLKQQGCTFYQGYLSSKAIPADAMERYIRRFQRKFA